MVLLVCTVHGGDGGIDGACRVFNRWRFILLQWRWTWTSLRGFVKSPRSIWRGSCGTGSRVYPREVRPTVGGDACFSFVLLLTFVRMSTGEDIVMKREQPACVLSLSPLETMAATVSGGGGGGATTTVGYVALLSDSLLVLNQVNVSWPWTVCDSY